MIFPEEYEIKTWENEKRLFISRPESITTDAFSPCCMSPDDVDYEMQQGKNSRMLEIIGMNQKSLEYFVQHYGGSYEYLSFFKCQLISDFSPLEDLKNLRAVSIYWNIRADKLWDFSKNDSMKSIYVQQAKKLTLNPDRLKTSKTIDTACFVGDIFGTYPMESLSCFEGMPALRQLWLGFIRLNDKSLDVLKTLPKLERFDFDAGMLTTEEIAWIAAKYPALQGKSICAYNTEDALLNDVRVCGYKKPSLDLPEQRKRLDKYVAQFNELVEKYKNEE